MTKGFYFVSLVVLVVSLFTLTSFAQNQNCVTFQADHLNDFIRGMDQTLAWNGSYRCMNREYTAYEEMLRKMQPRDRTGYSTMRSIVPTMNALIKEAEDNISWAMAKNRTCKEMEEHHKRVIDSLNDVLEFPDEDVCPGVKEAVSETIGHIQDGLDMMSNAESDRGKYIGLNQEYIGQANTIKEQVGASDLRGLGSRAPASIPIPSGF